ncbi:hypothetical protein FQN60_018732, partial [Etheostoma spectabile]
MSCPVNLQDLPSGVFETVFTPENTRTRTMTSLTPLSFPKTRSALWDSSPAGDKLRLQLCTRRKPRLVLMEKALRLAQRHARHSNKPRLLCFLLGSLCVDAASGRVPAALLPGDVLVPCLFSEETSSDAVVQSEAELHHCFKVLQQCVSGRQTLDVSQLLRVRGRVVCSQQSDAASFVLSWSAVCPSLSVDVQPVRAVPVIPTALLRSLTGARRPPLHAGRQRGFLTMDQTRKLLLLLESDPKASRLPLVGLWLSGVVQVYNPQVWAWCLRFLCSSALQDRVVSESGCFLLVLFGSTHRAPQFFQCRGSGSGPQLDYRLLTASQCVTLYQRIAAARRRSSERLRPPSTGTRVPCSLDPHPERRWVRVQSPLISGPAPREMLGEGPESPALWTCTQRDAGAAPLAAGLSVSDQDSGVEDEDLSPRPSPSPHPPAQQLGLQSEQLAGCRLRPQTGQEVCSSDSKQTRSPPSPPQHANLQPAAALQLLLRPNLRLHLHPLVPRTPPRTRPAQLSKVSTGYVSKVSTGYVSKVSMGYVSK